MVNDDERCLLALSLLDGEIESRQILADLLEEEGDAGLATWARGRKGNLRKQFEIALGVLPARVTVRIACEFAEHVMSQLTRHYPYGEPWREDIRLLLQWSIGESDETKIGGAATRLDGADCFDLTQGEGFSVAGMPAGPQWHLGRALTALANAAQNGLASCEARQPRLIRHHRNEAAHQARSVAMHSREELCCHSHSLKRDGIRTIGYQYLGRPEYGYHKYSTVPARKELSWQVKRLSDVLSDLV